LDDEEDAATREGEINEENRNVDRSRNETEDGTGKLKTTERNSTLVVVLLFC